MSVRSRRSLFISFKSSIWNELHINQFQSFFVQNKNLLYFKSIIKYIFQILYFVCLCQGELLHYFHCQDYFSFVFLPSNCWYTLSYTYTVYAEKMHSFDGWFMMGGARAQWVGSFRKQSSSSISNKKMF